MVRKQVYIEAEQDEWLKGRARELGLTESDLIREGINRLASQPSRGKPDLQAWEETLAFMRERAKVKSTATGRTWTRDELYEDRLNRISRRH
jgi:hypothetical protein